MTLNRLTQELTAFQSWLDFAEAMNKGYCPTLRTRRGTSQATKRHNLMIEELRFKLEERGWPTFGK